MAQIILKITFGIFMFLLFLSCNNEFPKSDEGQLRENVKYHSELGWKMEIPKGWENIPEDELKEQRKKLESQFSQISTDFKAFDDFGITLRKNRFDTFNSIYFLNENNSYTKTDFQKEKIEKYRILIDHNSNFTIDSTVTKSLKIGGKQFDFYTFLMEIKYEKPLKTTVYTGKVGNYQVLITVKTEDAVSESEILKCFYNSTFD
ncbi:hypothetical protein [Moheibacter lacus]|uniref:Lipoprotein n=1 Tax=Moheibacter lacus TaxID=2745851 RepID=A0A838ZGB0_9FLAO|nr:hypothetical protein [Moheibacter lacus]MBA5628308.1 hypothetical protein [Moheibacter lacus]